MLSILAELGWSPDIPLKCKELSVFFFFQEMPVNKAKSIGANFINFVNWLEIHVDLF